MIRGHLTQMSAEKMTQTIIYSEGAQKLPVPPFIFRLIRSFPWLLRLPLILKLVQWKLTNIDACQISPGFYAVVPEFLEANSVNLNDTVFINYAPVRIGAGTRFSGENLLLCSTHKPPNFETVIANPISIGKNVWVTYRCIILGGVSIGDNSIIGAGSVVTSDIPANVIAAGNPCKVIKGIYQ